MRLAVMSDTHGNVDAAESALKLAGEVDMVIHAGDHYRDGIRLQERTGIPVVAVYGNRDYPIRGPVEEVFDASGVQIYITHGHDFSVESRMGGLESRARELGAKVVVYGHTHVPDIQWLDGRLYINPGSLFRPRDGSGKTFAILKIIDAVPTVALMSLGS